MGMCGCQPDRHVTFILYTILEDCINQLRQTNRLLAHTREQAKSNNLDFLIRVHRSRSRKYRNRKRHLMEYTAPRKTNNHYDLHT